VSENQKQELTDLLQRKAIQNLIEAFRLSTRLPVAVVDRNGDSMVSSVPRDGSCSYCELLQSTAEGRRRCRVSLAKGGRLSAELGEPYIFRCHAGLIEITIPLLRDGEYLGAISSGRCLMWDLDEIALQELLLRCEELPISEERVKEGALCLPVLRSRSVQAVADLLFHCIGNAIPAEQDALAERQKIHQQQALLALEVHERKQSDAPEHVYPMEKERELLGRVRIGDRTGAKEILNQLLGSILFSNAARPDIIKARILELVVMLSRAAVEGGAALEKLLGMNYNYVQELATIEPMEELCAWIVRALDAFMDVVYESRDSKNMPVLRDAVRYIRENFMKDLTLDEVANAVHLSSYYLSHLFKEELGVTFVEYLTHVRIEEAKKLLLDPRRTVQQVSYMVGYQDPSYFTKVFKKLESRTPSQYRK